MYSFCHHYFVRGKKQKVKSFHRVIWPQSSIGLNQCKPLIATVCFLFSREVPTKPAIKASAKSDQWITSNCPSSTSAVVQENSPCLSPHPFIFTFQSKRNSPGHVLMLLQLHSKVFLQECILTRLWMPTQKTISNLCLSGCYCHHICTITYRF